MKLGYAGCRASNPLDVEVAIRQARLEGMYGKASDEAQLRDAARAGAAISLVDCTAVDKEHLVEGTRFYAIVRDEKIQQIVWDQILD